MHSKQLAVRCRELAENKKAENTVILDLRELSSVADYFVLATATSEPHVRAIVEEITEKLETEASLHPQACDGTPQTHWVVLDYFDVIVHVMQPDVREHYNLESLWSDAPRLRRPRAARRAPEGTLGLPRTRRRSATRSR